MDLQSFIRARGGAARTRELAAAGFGRGALAAAVRNGQLKRLLAGVYAVQNPNPDVAAAFRVNGLITCVSAGSFYNLWVLNQPGNQPRSPATSIRPGGLHLSCGNGLPRAGVVDHAPCRHPKHPYLPVAGLADVLLHALRCLPELESLVMVQSAAVRGLTTREFLREKLPGNRNGRARAVLDLLIPRADSLLEVLAHTHFVRAGLSVRMHVDVPGVGEVDCLVEGCLIVELDGSTHFEPRQVKKDHRRNNASVRGGFLALRYYYDDVVHHPDRMVAEIQAVLWQAAHGGFIPSGVSLFPIDRLQE